ncbi:MAG: hypothetical protein WAU07_02080, partial [Microgenomates group bacterium]
SLGEEKRQRFPGVKNEVYFNFIPRQAWENYAIFFSERIIVSSALEKKNLMSSYAKVRDSVSVIAPGVAQHKIIQNCCSKCPG